ncbi:MAG: peroxidase, partial [Alphaproteobacteria bacterium]|nr:peroxidase [Alphaproteobacteria bacterium]
MHHGMMDLRGIHHYCTASHERQRGDRFGRLFADLPGLYVDPATLQEIGAKGNTTGMDGGTGANRTQSVDVGQVFFGQFVDHDITLDVSSSLGQVTQASDVENVRTPTLDLDCIYGAGPESHGFMYDNGVKLLTGADSGSADPLAASDLARAANGRAIIGDHRNDENRIISQMQLAMIRAHNRICDKLNADEGLAGHGLYEKARRLLTWHYQWAVLNDFLPAMCGQGLVDDILANGRAVYCTEHGDPYIPIEFAVAAYRFGHSMVPQKIQIQKGAASHDLFGTILGGGFNPLSSADAIVDWRELFA